MIQRVDAIIKVKRGTDADRRTAFLSAGELAYTTDTKRFFVGDDSDGGVPVSIRTHFNNRNTTNALPGDFYVDTATTAGTTEFYILTGTDHTNPNHYVFIANNAADVALTTVQENSARWGIAGGLQGTDAYSLLQTYSAGWEDTHTLYSQNSALYTKKYTQNFGDGAAKIFTIIHGLDSKNAVANVIENATDEVVYTSIQYTTANSLTITFANAPALTAFRVVVVA